MLIEEAATRAFAERGYEATMQDIAAEAGVVASVIYDHFSSKRQLYVALFEKHGRALVDQSVRAARGPDFRAGLRSQIDIFFGIVEADPFLWRMLFRDPPRDPKLIAVHAAFHIGAAEAIARALGTGRNESPAATPPTTTLLVAEMVKSALDGLAAWWWENRDVDRATLVDTATSLLWEGLSVQIASQ